MTKRMVVAALAWCGMPCHPHRRKVRAGLNGGNPNRHGFIRNTVTVAQMLERRTPSVYRDSRRPRLITAARLIQVFGADRLDASYGEPRQPALHAGQQPAVDRWRTEAIQERCVIRLDENWFDAIAPVHQEQIQPGYQHQALKVGRVREWFPLRKTLEEAPGHRVDAGPKLIDLVSLCT